MQTSVKFTKLIGSLAVIQGSVRLDGDHLEFELAMTESVSGPVDGVLKRVVELADLESVEVTRRLFRKSKLEFVANSVSTFKGIPGSKGFNYTMLALSPHKKAVSFVREVLFEMAQVEMRRLDGRFSDD